ncbi:MAG: hypothetical protein II040_08285 [Muribaculaceae bacterium]|nr:hypothetical protein [Muribaculaceae bacterium]
MAEKRVMKYRDELDKSYGVAGMALGLSVFDAADLFTSITLDGDGPGAIEFTPEFFFAGNPRLSPRGSWQYMLGHFRISVGLAVANALCRRMVLDNDKADQQLRDQLLNAACDDGRDYCQLERDEVQPIFDEAFENMSRLFADSRVRKAMDSFADALQQRRTLSHIDVVDILQQLNLI